MQHPRPFHRVHGEARQEDHRQSEGEPDQWAGRAPREIVLAVLVDVAVATPPAPADGDEAECAVEHDNDGGTAHPWRTRRRRERHPSLLSIACQRMICTWRLRTKG